MASAGIIDAQSRKRTDTVGRPSRGFDAGKKVNRRKRHVLLDTLGLLMLVAVTTASVQDRDGGTPILARLRFVMPSLVTVFTDSGYVGWLAVYARPVLKLVAELVKKPTDQRAFAVLAHRWAVERTLAWLVRCRRLNHDYERLPATDEAWIKWAMISIMVRRLEPGLGRRPWRSAHAA